MRSPYLAGRHAALTKYAFDYLGAHQPADNQAETSSIGQAFSQNSALGEGTSDMAQPPMMNISQSINPVFGTPGMVITDSSEEKGAYDLGVKQALASFSPVPPPPAAKVQTAGQPATINSPRVNQAATSPALKIPASPTAPQASASPPPPPKPVGAELPSTATAAQVAASNLQINTQRMTTQNPAFKLGGFNSEIYPVKAKPGEIKPDNDDNQLATNFMPSNNGTAHLVSEAFNGLSTMRPTDFVNAGNEGTVGALP